MRLACAAIHGDVLTELYTGREPLVYLRAVSVIQTWWRSSRYYNHRARVRGKGLKTELSAVRSERQLTELEAGTLGLRRTLSSGPIDRIEHGTVGKYYSAPAASPMHPRENHHHTDASCESSEDSQRDIDIAVQEKTPIFRSIGSNRDLVEMQLDGSCDPVVPLSLM